jgi:WXG100 family type VII secretion target
MSDGHMLVTFSAIENAAGDNDITAGNIDSQLADLRSYLAPLVASWEGSAAEGYQALQAKWDAAVDDLNAVLRQIAMNLRTAQDNYQSGEQANSATWG